MNLLIIILVSILFISISISDAASEHEHIRVIVLSGSKRDMGLEYGKLMKNNMLQNLNILKKFSEKYQIPYAKLVDLSNSFFVTFDKSYQHFIESISEGSDGLLTLDDVKVLNAQETFHKLFFKTQSTLNSACAFLFLPSHMTITGSSLIARNYDFDTPWDEIADLLSLVILKENNKRATAIIGFPGQIYCPTCINSNGIFMEINNGGKYCKNAYSRNGISLLNKLLMTLQEFGDLSSINQTLNNAYSNHCLIVNAADKNRVLNLEFNKSYEMRSYYPEVPFVSTNFFLNPAWGNLHPTDNDTFNGLTRRDNLLKLIWNENNFDIQKLKNAMDLHVFQGGARWNKTIYQMIFDSNTFDLYLKITANPKFTWIKISLKPYFNNRELPRTEI